MELKKLLFDEILPLWNKHAEDFVLNISDIIMRNKDWCEIRPQTPDCDAILSPSFYKQGKGGLIFKIGSRVLVYFHVPNDIYEAYDRWCEQQEYNSLAQDVSLSFLEFSNII